MYDFSFHTSSESMSTRAGSLTLGLEVCAKLGELLALDGAARRVVLRIEIQDGAAPLEIVAAQAAASARGEVEGWNRVTRRHASTSSVMVQPADRAQSRTCGLASYTRTGCPPPHHVPPPMGR